MTLELTDKLSKTDFKINAVNVFTDTLGSTKLLNQLIITKGQFQHRETASHSQEGYCIEAQGKWTFMPGWLDTHVHGQGGYDFADIGQSQELLPKITKALGETGLSYAMATFVSLDLPTLKKALSSLNTYLQQEAINPTKGSTKLVGVHLEGPFIAKKCKGAHEETVLQPEITLELFKEIISAAPCVKEWKITLDPELPGALQFMKDVKNLESEGIFTHVFIGHCNPEDKSLLSKAIELGAKGLTHLGNACQESCARSELALVDSDSTSHVVQWVLENPERCPNGVELIVDGVHLSKSFVSMLRQKIGDKLVLITDALGPTGLKEGHYTLGNLPIIKDKDCFYLADSKGNYLTKETKTPQGTTEHSKILAGSAAELSHCAALYASWVDNATKALYLALIKNPRKSSLSPLAIQNLPDPQNGVIIDEQGRMILSLCNGVLRVHDETCLDVIKTYSTQPEHYASTFFSTNKSSDKYKDIPCNLTTTV